MGVQGLVAQAERESISRRTKAANAALTGIGSSRRIILGDTLINEFTPDEIETVLAHEIGHFKRKHILKGIIRGSVISFFLFYLCFRFLEVRSLAIGSPEEAADESS